MSVSRSASGDGDSPRFCIRASTNRSIALRAQPSRLTVGTAGRCGGTNAQCSAYSAPSSIQRANSVFCSAESMSPVCGGGITSSGSSDRIRRIISLSSAAAGTIAPQSIAASRTSSRRSASRCPSSGPWHAKQLADSIGRMSRLKSIGCRRCPIEASPIASRLAPAAPRLVPSASRLAPAAPSRGRGCPSPALKTAPESSAATKATATPPVIDDQRRPVHIAIPLRPLTVAPPLAECTAETSPSRSQSAPATIAGNQTAPPNAFSPPQTNNTPPRPKPRRGEYVERSQNRRYWTRTSDLFRVKEAR